MINLKYKKFFLISFFLCSFLLSCSRYGNSLTYNSDIINTNLEYEFNLNANGTRNDVYSPEQYLTFAQFTDNVNYNTYFSNMSYAQTSYSHENTNYYTNISVKSMKFTPSNNMGCVNLYMRNSTCQKPFYFSTYFIVPNTTENGSLFQFILNSDRDFSCSLQKSNNKYYLGVINESCYDNSTYIYETIGIDASVIEDKMISLEMQLLKYSSTRLGLQCELWYDFDNGSFPTLVIYELYTTYLTVNLTSIDIVFPSLFTISGFDSTMFLAFDKEILNHDEYNIIQKHYIYFSINQGNDFRLMNNYQAVKFPEYDMYSGYNYTKFDNFNDSINNFDYVNSSYLFNNDRYLISKNNFFEKTTNLLLDDYYDYQHGITDAFSSTSGTSYMFRNLNSSKTTISMSFYLYVNIGIAGERSFGFYDLALNSIGVVMIRSNHLYSWGAIGETDWGVVFPQSDWYFFEISINTVSDILLCDVNNVNIITASSINAYSLQTITVLSISTTPTYFTYFSYQANSESRVYCIDWDKYLYGTSNALSISMADNEYINFTNPNPLSVWGYNQTFYFTTDFEYVNGINYTINFGLIKYHLNLNDTHFTVLRSDNFTIIDQFVYIKIPNLLNKNVRFTCAFGYYGNLATSFSLIYDKYIIAMNQVFHTGHHPQNNCQSIYFSASNTLTLILKNMQTYDWSHYVNNHFLIYNNPKFTGPLTNLLYSYTVPLPPFALTDDYILVNAYFLSAEISQNANTSNLASICYFQNTPIIFYLTAFATQEVEFNSTFQPTNILIEIYSSQNLYVKHTIELETYILYYLKSTDVLNVIISFAPTLLIFILFPFLFYEKFKKWGVIIGIFCSTILLAFINNFSIAQTIILLLIVILLIIVLIKYQKKDEINDF